MKNLVPTPDSELWQVCPEAPFMELTSEAAKGALACCNLRSSLQRGQDERGRAAYACSAGETVFYRRQPQQLSSTLAFMLGHDDSRFFRLRATDVPKVRECLHWLKANNPHLKTFLASAERFPDLYSKLQSVVPRAEGEVKVRMQRTRRVSNVVESTLQETLGSEDTVLVVIDPAELPRSWASVDVFGEAIGEAEYRISAVPADSGASETASVALSSTDAQALQSTAKALRSQAKVTLGDPHLDAKLFPHLHPYGTGSLRSEEGAGGIQQYAKSRLLSLDHAFRKTAVWSFYMLERIIKNDL